MSAAPSLPADVRVPPNSAEAEAAVLSCVVYQESGFDDAIEILKSSDRFYSESHRRIFEAQCELREAGKPIDAVTLVEQLRTSNRLQQVGGVAYVTQVLNAAPGLNVKTYAQQVADTWRRRQLIFASQRFAAEAYAGGRPVQDMVSDAAQFVSELAVDESRVGFEPIGKLLQQTFTDINAIVKRGAQMSGMSTGFARYDRLTSGLNDGELTIVAARPGMGKTALVLNMAVNVAAQAPENVVGLFSLEMPKKQLVPRILASESKTDASKLRTGMLSPNDWSNLYTGAKFLSNLGVEIDDTPAITLATLRAKLRRLANEQLRKGRRVVLAAVDYLQLMNGNGEESREQEISAISRGLKQIAKEMGIPLIALSQLNRECETRAKDKRPQLSDLRESGAIEQDADNVCFIYRDDYYNKRTIDRNIAELIIAKQRNGPTDTVKVRWDPQYTRFDNLADGEYEDYHDDG